MYNTWVDGYHRIRRRPVEFLSGDISDAELAAHARHALRPGLSGLRSAEAEALDALGDDQIAAALEAFIREFSARSFTSADVDGLRYRGGVQIMEIPIGTVMSRLRVRTGDPVATANSRRSAALAAMR